jgi:hypothetical protein
VGQGVVAGVGEVLAGQVHDRGEERGGNGDDGGDLGAAGAGRGEVLEVALELEVGEAELAGARAVVVPGSAINDHGAGQGLRAEHGGDDAACAAQPEAEQGGGGVAEEPGVAIGRSDLAEQCVLLIGGSSWYAWH